MDITTSQVFVRFIDNTEVHIPIRAGCIGDGIFQLMRAVEFDYIDDSALFEFGSEDIVRVKEHEGESGEQYLLAYELVMNGDKRNIEKRLLFKIFTEQPQPEAVFDPMGADEIEALCKKIKKSRRMYPDIKNWLTVHFEEIGRMHLEKSSPPSVPMTIADVIRTLLSGIAQGIKNNLKKR